LGVSAKLADSGGDDLGDSGDTGYEADQRAITARFKSPMADDVAYLSLLEVSERIRRRELTSETVTSALLERIERFDGGLHSFQMVLADPAMKQARTADREIASGQWRGPLHGVPIAIKDLLSTKGLATTAGMEILDDFVPTEDATAVARLKRAGAVLIGKLHMTEGATLDHHPNRPRPVNPWSAAHWTGASSSGSGIAPAAGFCYGALGTDSAGSIRMPAAANNLTGVKPTWGRVSRHGLLPICESFDHIGPMARSAGDTAAILAAIAGADPADPTALTEPVPDYLASLGQGVGDLVIGIDWRYATEGMATEIVAAVRNAAEVFAFLGARVREIDFPSTEVVNTEIAPILTAEALVAHAAHFPAKADRYGRRMREMLEAAGRFDPQMVARGYQARDRFSGALRTTFLDVDLILVPGLGCILPTWDELGAMASDLGSLGRTVMRYTTPFNVAGVPTISLPGGFTQAGLPVGIQLVGWRLAEPMLLRAGHAFQQVSDFHTLRAPLD
jgi:amidase